MFFIYIPIIVSFIALVFAAILFSGVTKQKVENEKAKEISRIIYKGAKTFLNKEHKLLVFFVIIISVILYFLINHNIAWTFLCGAAFSVVAGNLGMRIAALSNARAAEAANKNLKNALKLAFNSSSAIGMVVAGFGLLGVTILYLIFDNPQILYGFGLGASLTALFIRVGGGIYTKAADIGADLVGKIEAGISEDDPRNPVTIADNVGDNVGDVAGIGADLFESYVDAIITVMVIGSLGILFEPQMLMNLPLILASVGIIGAIIGNIFVRVSKKNFSSHKFLNRGVFCATIITATISLFAIKLITGKFILFWPFVIGLASGIGIGLIIEFFTSYNFKPTQKVAVSAQTGPATNILKGLSLGMLSTLVPTLIISLAILSYFFADIYGIAITAIGMVSILGIILAVGAFGPIIDNAAGIAEMSKMSKKTKQITKELDAVGNTTAAIGKGFAIGSAILTCLVLLIGYKIVANLEIIDLFNPITLIGLFIGGLVPFLFSSFIISAIGKAVMKIIQEARKQFKKIKGLLSGEAKPDYIRCIAISTEAAFKEMILPGALAIITPVLVGFLLGPEALGGLLIGAIISGFLLALTMVNSGATWDNAKKYIEAGNLGGMGSEAHKASVIGDTLGDSFKDAAGPSINILLKLMAIIALIIAPLL